MTDAGLIKELDAKGLRNFALSTGGIVAVLFGVGFPWLLERPSPIWPWAIAGVLIAWGLIAPRSLRPVYRGWMRFGLLLNRVTSPVVLGTVFFLLVTPIALFMRLRGRDAMGRGFDSKAATYRLPSRKAPKRNMEKPF